MKRVLIIANKNWEVEPILNTLLNYKLRSQELPNPTILNYPWTFPQGVSKPRAIWDNFANVTIELWCIQDLMDVRWNSSSSQGKNIDLPRAINYRTEKPDLIIACGTGAFGSETENNNGCVVIGSNIFIHNFHPNGENPQSIWDDLVNFEKLIPSNIDNSFFALFDYLTIKSIEEKFLKPYLNPANQIQILASKDFLGLSTVNITDYRDYATSDQIGIKAILDAGISLKVGSVETTHGIIRIQCDAPFIFITGITDQLGKFATEVNGCDAKGNIKTEAQNYSVAFNVGVSLAWLIPKIAFFIKA